LYNLKKHGIGETVTETPSTESGHTADRQTKQLLIAEKQWLGNSGWETVAHL